MRNIFCALFIRSDGSACFVRWLAVAEISQLFPTLNQVCPVRVSICARGTRSNRNVSITTSNKHTIIISSISLQSPPLGHAAENMARHTKE